MDRESSTQSAARLSPLGGNIAESQQFASADTGSFFMRLQVEAVAQEDTFGEASAPRSRRSPSAST